MVEAMLSGWRAQQNARGLQEDTIAPRERLVRRFLVFTNEYPWNWGPSHVDEWTGSLTGEKQLAPSTIRGYQTDRPVSVPQAVDPSPSPVDDVHDQLTHIFEEVARVTGRVVAQTASADPSTSRSRGATAGTAMPVG